MTSSLLKYLNNQITIWENTYGDLYTQLYDEEGHLIPTNNKILQDDMFKWLYAAQQTMSVLKKIKRNRFIEIKKLEKKRYKLKYFHKNEKEKKHD